MENYLYFDTNILSELAKNENWWDSLKLFVTDANLTLAVSGAQLAELSDAVNLHESITNLFWHVPTKAVLTWDEILYRRLDEGNLYDPIEIGIFPYLLRNTKDVNPKEQFRTVLPDQKMKEARDIQLSDAKKMRSQIFNNKGNFSPNSQGKYTPTQASEFSRRLTIQFCQNSKHLPTKVRDELVHLYKQEGNKIDHFQAIEVYSHFIFYKYYIACHSGKNLSDFGDLFHVFYLPFVSLAILERGMTEILNQIKRNHSLLDNVQIENIDYFRKEILKI